MGLLGHDLMIGCGVSAVLSCHCHFRVLKSTEPTMHLTGKKALHLGTNYGTTGSEVIATEWTRYSKEGI